MYTEFSQLHWARETNILIWKHGNWCSCFLARKQLHLSLSASFGIQKRAIDSCSSTAKANIGLWEGAWLVVYLAEDPEGHMIRGCRVEGVAFWAPLPRPQLPVCLFHGSKTESWVRLCWGVQVQRPPQSKRTFVPLPWDELPLPQCYFASISLKKVKEMEGEREQG